MITMVRTWCGFWLVQGCPAMLAGLQGRILAPPGCDQAQGAMLA